MTDILVLEDAAGDVAERLVAVAGAGGHVALAGGSTPRLAYELAAGLDADWSAATLWFGDERCVPPDHPDSNYAMVKAALLERLSGEPPAVRRIAGELGPQAAAEAYERELVASFPDRQPELDLVLLGIGSDGHCASLFPGGDALEATDRLVVGVDEPGLAPWLPRVTLTLNAINAAGQVLFLATGAEKATVAARAFGGRPDPATPASLVAPTSGSLTVILDPAAAAGLGEEALR